MLANEGRTSPRPESGAPLISVVSPVYRAAEIVPRLVAEIERYVRKVTDDFEIVLVDDGSPDRSWDAIARACAEKPHVHGLRLSRNFGQQSALSAGLAHAKGEYVVLMDCDLQDEPRHIPELFRLVRQEWDVVYTLKRARRHSFVRNLTGGLFHRLQSLVMGRAGASDPRIGNYTILTRQVVDAYNGLGDYQRSYLAQLRFLGFRSTVLEIDHCERVEGESSYSFWRLVRVAVGAMTSESNRPLYLSIGLGLSFVAVSLMAAAYLVVAHFMRSFLEGWTSLIVLNLLSTGVTLVSLGIASIYIAKTFEQSRNRPPFIVMASLNVPSRAGPDSARVSAPRREGDG